MKIDSIEQARKMARIKAVDAAPIWGLPTNQIRRYCITGRIPGAVRLGTAWYVTPQGMDAMFEGKGKKK